MRPRRWPLDARRRAGREVTPGDPALASLYARTMRAMAGARQVSPVEIMAAVLARIGAVEPRLNAFAALDADGRWTPTG